MDPKYTFILLASVSRSLKKFSTTEHNPPSLTNVSRLQGKSRLTDGETKTLEAEERAERVTDPSAGSWEKTNEINTSWKNKFKKKNYHLHQPTRKNIYIIFDKYVTLLIQTVH